MDRRLPGWVGVVLLVALVTVIASPGAALAAGSRTFTTVMTGAEEVPGPGDPDGSGVATIRLIPEEFEVCFELAVTDIQPATAAHVHRGPVGVAGPIVVPLAPPTEGASRGCVEGVDPVLIKDIGRHPDQFYVNVHNAEFPAGAVRGQLG